MCINTGKFTTKYKTRVYHTTKSLKDICWWLSFMWICYSKTSKIEKKINKLSIYGHYHVIIFAITDFKWASTLKSSYSGAHPIHQQVFPMRPQFHYIVMNWKLLNHPPHYPFAPPTHPTAPSKGSGFDFKYIISKCIEVFPFMNISIGIALRRMSRDPTRLDCRHQNGLVPSDNKLLKKPILTKIHDASLGHSTTLS